MRSNFVFLRCLISPKIFCSRVIAYQKYDLYDRYTNCYDFKRLIWPGDSPKHPTVGWTECWTLTYCWPPKYGSLECCTSWTVINLASGAMKVFFRLVVFLYFIVVNRFRLPPPGTTFPHYSGFEERTLQDCFSPPSHCPKKRILFGTSRSISRVTMYF